MADADFSPSFNEHFDKKSKGAKGGEINQDAAFSTTSNPFATVSGEFVIESDDDDVPRSPLLCGLNCSFLQYHGWFHSAVGKGGDKASIGNDIFEVFDSAGNNTPSTANAFSNFDKDWCEAPDQTTERSQSVQEEAFAEFDPATKDDTERSPPRRSSSSRGDKRRSRKPRRKSANSSSAPSAEGLDGSFNEMNLSNSDDQRTPKKVHSRSSTRRGLRDGEEAEDRSPPRRKGSSRGSRRTST